MKDELMIIILYRAQGVDVWWMETSAAITSRARAGGVRGGALGSHMTSWEARGGERGRERPLALVERQRAPRESGAFESTCCK